MEEREEFVTHDIALELKALGYQGRCMAKYDVSITEQEHEEDGKSGPFGWEKGEVLFDKSFFINNYEACDFSNKDWVSAGAPTIQSAFKWLRDKFGLWHIVEHTPGYDDYYAVVEDHNWPRVHSRDELRVSEKFHGYEAAEIACLKKIIEAIKSKK